MFLIGFEKLIYFLFFISYRTSFDTLVDILKNMMSHEKEIDAQQNGLDNQHDLPVYHRIRDTLNTFKHEVDNFESEKKRQFSSLASVVLQFSKTFAPIMGELMIKTVQTKEELEQVLKVLEENLPSYYFQRIVAELAKFITNGNSCSFIAQLTVEQKLDLAEWFIQEKKRPAFIFDLLKDSVFNQSSVDKQRCQSLIQQLRQSDDLYLKQQAMEYTVSWD